MKRWRRCGRGEAGVRWDEYMKIMRKEVVLEIWDGRI